MPVDATVPGEYTLLEIVSFLMTPVAPELIWIPFWAVVDVGPTPMIVVCSISPEEPVPSTVTPFFW